MYVCNENVYNNKYSLYLLLRICHSVVLIHDYSYTTSKGVLFKYAHLLYHRLSQYTALRGGVCVLDTLTSKPKKCTFYPSYVPLTVSLMFLPVCSAVHVPAVSLPGLHPCKRCLSQRHQASKSPAQS